MRGRCSLYVSLSEPVGSGIDGSSDVQGPIADFLLIGDNDSRDLKKKSFFEIFRLLMSNNWNKDES